MPPSLRSTFEASVLDGLRALEAALATGRPPAPNLALRAALAHLDQLTANLPAQLNPDLRHYLLKHSYEKARILLEGGDPEAGACPR